MSPTPSAGFHVVYRWRLREGSEASFRAAWSAVTQAIRHEHGGLGSRLHRAEGGWWVAYAAWPERARWEAMQAAQSVLPDEASVMRAAILESAPPLLLEPVEDLLVADRADQGSARSNTSRAARPPDPTA